MISQGVMYFFGLLAVLSSLYILFTNNILYAAFSLVVTLLSVAILYLAAGAEFVGVTQIMIYVGGIIVLMIFGIMLTNEQRVKTNKKAAHNKFMAFVISISIFSILLYAILRLNLGDIKIGVEGNVKELGLALMTEYLLPFELAAVLLLLVLMAASVIASPKKEIN